MDVIFRSPAMDAPRPSYANRAALAATPPLADHLLQLMELKQSNICLAAENAEGMTSAELLKLAHDCGDAIVVLKLHSDAIWDLSPETVRDLTAISKQKGFLLFDDRLFSGSSPSVAAQYAATRLHPGSWTSLTSAHIFHGSNVVKVLRNAAVELISNMPSEEQDDSPQQNNHVFSHRWRNDSASYFSTRQSFDHTDSSSLPVEEIQSPKAPNHFPAQPPKSGAISRKSGSKHVSTPSRTSLLSQSALADAYQAQGQRPPMQRNPSGHSTRQPLSPSAMASVVAPFDRRKSSIVSVNTTISSSTEYIGSSAAANTRNPQSASITMSASSPNISPGREDLANQKLCKGPPPSRGILLNTDIDSSIFQQSTIIGAYAADSSLNCFQRACVKAARLDKDFVLGFVSDGEIAARNRANGSPKSTPTSDTAFKFLNFVSNCCFADDRLHLEREKRRVGRSATPTLSCQTNGNESSEEEPDDSDVEGSDSDQKLAGSIPRQPLIDVSPAALIHHQRADVLIVGAPVIHALDKRETVERYRKAGWDAYLEALAQQPYSSPTH